MLISRHVDAREEMVGEGHGEASPASVLLRQLLHELLRDSSCLFEDLLLSVRCSPFSLCSFGVKAVQGCRPAVLRSNSSCETIDYNPPRDVKDVASRRVEITA